MKGILKRKLRRTCPAEYHGDYPDSQILLGISKGEIRILHKNTF